MRFQWIKEEIHAGDRVRYTRKSGSCVKYGETGTVLTEPEPILLPSINSVAVCWDKEGPEKYSLLGCPPHRGWVVNYKDLEKIF